MVRTQSQSSAIVDAVSVVVLVFILVASTFALGRSDPQIQANETRASVSGATLPAITFSGGATAGKATRTLTVNTTPGDSETITIGTCVVSFLSGTEASTNDTNCNNNNASIYTQITDDFFNLTVLSETEVATLLQSLSNVSDTGHGALTVSAPSATTARFTTTGSETSATEISFTDNTGGDITSSASSPGVLVAAAATASLTVPSALSAGSLDHSVTIDGVAITLGSSASSEPSVARTKAEVAADIAAASFSSGTSYGANGAYTASASGDTVTFTRSATGSGGNASITIADATYGSVAQVVTFTPANLLDGPIYIYSITINGVTSEYRYRNATAKGIVENFNNAFSSHADVDCTEDDVTLTCTASNPGTAFTYSTSVTLVPNTGSSNVSPPPPASKPSPTVVSPTPTNNAPTTTVVQPENNFVNNESESDTDSTDANNITRPTVEIAEISEPVSPSSPFIPFTPVEKIFTQNLSPGISNAVLGPSVDEVSRLQEFLGKNPLFYPENIVTGYFGEFTRAAVLRFQLTYGIVSSPADPGAGEFGPRTRELANWLEFFRRTVEKSQVR